jgi:hypothetical protein
LILSRCGKQRLREARIQGVDYLILCLAGICLGTLAKVSDETFGALGYTYTVIAVCKYAYMHGFNSVMRSNACLACAFDQSIK